MSKETQKFLLRLARRAIGQYLETGEELEIEEKIVPEEARGNKGCFVTLEKKGQLRGCIGNILPAGPLYKAVAHNALAAAFEDSRFSPLQKEELPEIKIEISVLTRQERLDYTDAEDLTQKLLVDKPGIIIQKSIYQATFLPQVWEELPNPEDFLSHLCLKAGLSPQEWQNGDLEIFTYRVEVFR